MSTTSENNKRIAKNTLLLYIRMLFTMGVSLYTSRIVLNTLGVNDFGIYNVVGGVLALFSFLNGGMTSAIQRFLAFELGKPDGNFRKIFSMSLLIQSNICAVILILAETVGLYIVTHKLNIPSGKEEIALWVYQISILTMLIEVMKVPYNASIIAQEKMSFFAYLSIIEAGLKLSVAVSLLYISESKLVLYAGLLCSVSVITWTFYYIYCRFKLKIKSSFYWNKKLYIEMLSFSGWSFVGSASYAASNQGVNVLLNMFWGVGINAATGIATQVSNAIYSFIMNFQTAFKPQLTKSYAAGNIGYVRSLLIRTSKISFLLFLFISMPFLIKMESILSLWLGIVPPYAVVFCRLWIVILLIDSLRSPFWLVIHATGKIRWHETIFALLLWIYVGLSYLILYEGAQPESVFYIRILINLCVIGFELFLLGNIVGKLWNEYKIILFRMVLVIGIAILVPSFFLLYTSLNGLIPIFILSFITTGLSAYYIGLNRNEKEYFTKIIKNKIFSKKGKHLPDQ